MIVGILPEAVAGHVQHTVFITVILHRAIPPPKCERNHNAGHEAFMKLSPIFIKQKRLPCNDGEPRRHFLLLQVSVPVSFINIFINHETFRSGA